MRPGPPPGERYKHILQREGPRVHLFPLEQTAFATEDTENTEDGNGSIMGILGT